VKVPELMPCTVGVREAGDDEVPVALLHDVADHPRLDRDAGEKPLPQPLVLLGLPMDEVAGAHGIGTIPREDAPRERRRARPETAVDLGLVTAPVEDQDAVAASGRGGRLRHVDDATRRPARDSEAQKVVPRIPRSSSPESGRFPARAG
jgi:hypothetical protein